MVTCRHRNGWPRSRADGGAATVWTAIAIAGLFTMASLLFWLGIAAVTRHRAANAADLAALAAAAHARHGQVTACAKAGSVTEHMGARMLECRFEDWDALVRVEIVPAGPLSRFGAAHARARAGPVGSTRTTSGTSSG